MKHLHVLIISALLFVVPVFGETVSPQRAQKIASAFLGQNDGSGLNMAEPVNMTKSTSGFIPYYVFNRDGGGFVVIAGDDSSKPILAYSHNGYFDVANMNDNLAYWMSSIELKILNNRNSSHSDTNQKWSEEWERLSDVGTKSSSNNNSKILQTAAWGQNAPYNNMCPVIDGRRSVTGCVATSTAIVMRYHKWPDAGVGVLPDYKNTRNNGEIQPGHALGHEYDWDNMPLEYGWDSTTAQNDAVARLMYDVGIMCNMLYGTSSSSGFFDESLLTKYMKYDKGIVYLERGNYSDGKWFSIIKKEIDENRPVLYSGYPEEGGAGHQFVVDGYDADGMIHINWGWGNNDEGFFTLDNWYPERQDMYIGIKPFRGTYPSQLDLCYSGVLIQYDYYYHLRGVRETYYRAINAQIALWRFDKHGNMIEMVTAPVEYSGDNWASFTLDGIKEGDFGDYLHPCYCIDGGDTWLPMTYLGPDDSGYYPLFDKTELEKVTHMSYDKTTRIAKIFSDVDVKFSLLDDNGTEFDLLNNGMGYAELDLTKVKTCNCTINVRLNGQSIGFRIKGYQYESGTENVKRGEDILW